MPPLLLTPNEDQVHPAMLKTYAFPAVLLLAAMPSQAQIVTLEDLDGNLVNEQAVTVLASEDGLQELDLLATLTGSVSKTVNLKRYELNTVPGSENYFCWGVCYLPVGSGVKPYWLSLDSVVMTPGSEFNGFHSYYIPNGTSAVAGFRFVWYDIADHNDSTWVDIFFDTEHVGLQELSVEHFDAFPNPSIGNDITIEHGLVGTSTNARLVMYDALGTARFATAIGNSTITRIKAGTIPAGVYLATIEDHGRPMATRIVVVASR